MKKLYFIFLAMVFFMPSLSFASIQQSYNTQYYSSTTGLYPSYIDPTYPFYIWGTGGVDSTWIKLRIQDVIVGVNEIRLPICRTGGTGAGTLGIEVYFHASTTASGGTMVASSSIPASGVSATGCATAGFLSNATSSSFTLNNSFNVSTDDLWVHLYYIGTDGNFYTTNAHGFGDNSELWIANTQYIYLTKQQRPVIELLSSSTVTYSSSWASAIAQSIASTTLPECGITKIGGCIAQAFAWAFYPDVTKLEEIKSLTLASTTPFSYLYQLSGYLTTLRNGTSTATGTALIIPFAGNQIEVFDTQDIGSYLGTGANTIKNALAWMFWLLALFVAYREIYSIFHKGDNTETT